MCKPGRETYIWRSRRQTLVQGEAQMPTARFVPWFTMVQNARINCAKLHSGKEEET